MHKTLKVPFPKCFLDGNDGNGNRKRQKEYHNWGTLAGLIYESHYSNKMQCLKRADRLQLLKEIEQAAKFPPIFKPPYTASALTRHCYEAKKQIESL